MHDCRAAAHFLGTCVVCQVWCITLGTTAGPLLLVVAGEAQWTSGAMPQ